MIEVHKFLNGLSPDIMSRIFSTRQNVYNTRNFNIFETSMPHSNRFGLNSITYRSNQLWNLVPDNMKQSKTLASFKQALKSWKCLSCPCTLCKTYVPNLGYL